MLRCTYKEEQKMIVLIIIVLILIVVTVVAYKNAPNRPTCLLTYDDCINPSIDCKDCWVNKKLSKGTGCALGGRS